MPRKKKPPSPVLEDPRYELTAQELADGRTQWQAYLLVNEPGATLEEVIQRYKDLPKEEKSRLVARAGSFCRNSQIRQRVVTILAERHQKRMAIKAYEVKVTSSYVTDRLVTLVDRCMQAVPVKNGQNDAIGMWRFEPIAACKALELLGLEQGMFERTHKHLHTRQNPLDGNRDEIVGRLGVLLDQLSDADLYSIGLQRLDVVEVRIERVDGVAGQQSPALQALPEAS